MGKRDERVKSDRGLKNLRPQNAMGSSEERAGKREIDQTSGPEL